MPRKKHRRLALLLLLLKGVLEYLRYYDKQYLFGCSSFYSQNPGIGWKAFEFFQQNGQFWNDAPIETREKYDCPKIETTETFEVPKILNVYMTYGAEICSYPALDKEFKSIDFLTLFDIKKMKQKHLDFFYDQ